MTATCSKRVVDGHTSNNVQTGFICRMRYGTLLQISPEWVSIIRSTSYEHRHTAHSILFTCVLFSSLDPHTQPPQHVCWSSIEILSHHPASLFHHSHVNSTGEGCPWSF